MDSSQFDETLTSLDKSIETMDAFADRLNRGMVEWADDFSLQVARDFVRSGIKHLRHLESLQGSEPSSADIADPADSTANIFEQLQEIREKEQAIIADIVPPNPDILYTGVVERSSILMPDGLEEAGLPEIEILQDDVIRVNDVVIELSRQELFIFNVLLVYKGLPIGRTIFFEAGFDGTDSAYTNSRQSLKRKLSDGFSDIPLLGKIGGRTNARYLLAAALAVVDRRSESIEVERQRRQSSQAKTAAAKQASTESSDEKGGHPRSKESLRRDELFRKMREIANRKKN